MSEDRASRSEFWYWQLFTMLASIPCDVADFMLFHTREIGPLGIAFFLVTLLPSLFVTARRLHDVNRSFYWILLSATFIGLIPLLYWMVKPGTRGENRFGPDPLISRS